MLLLAVESATDAAAVALADENGALGSVVVARGRRHTETIAPAIDALCRRVGVTLADLDMLAVDIGPGLFTGLRVGVGTVQALSFALDLPVVTATSLEVLAHAVIGSGTAHHRLVVPVVDARRAEVFSARFRSGPGGSGPRPEGTDPGADTDHLADTDDAAGAVGSPEALAAELGALSEPVVLAGDGALRYRALFAALAGATVLGPAYAAPPVTALAELALARGRAGHLHSGASVRPRYLRQADARINWEQRLAPRSPAAAGG
jgi:tRNA threonylcarbamoyladenosine biosynthesis protein TsaB